MKTLLQLNPYRYLNNKQKIVFTFFLLLTIPFNLIKEPASGMEASWQIGLNMALRQGLVWGKDIIFTYGPLGFLQTRLALYVSDFPIILFSVFVWSNVLFIFFYFLKKCKLTSIFDFIFAIIIVLMFHYIIKVEVSTTLLYIILFYLLYSLRHKSYIPVVIATLTGSLAIFIKVTYFFPLLVIYGLYMGAIIFFDTWMNPKKIVLIYVFNIVLIFLLCVYLKVDFQRYISASFHIVAAYNDAMMEAPSKESALTTPLRLIFPDSSPVFLSLLILFITFIITMPFIVMAVYNLRKNQFHFSTALTVLFCLFFLFLTFKYGFVRHGGLIYLYPPVLLYLLGLLTNFGEIEIKWARLYIYCICIVLFIPSVILVNKHLMQRNTYTYYSLFFKARNVLRKQSPELNIKSQKLLTQSIPDSVIHKIGNQTVDIIPMEVSLVYFNNLQYRPRPVLQSYSAYDTYLDTKNFDFYNSTVAPNFVIYNTTTIDSRYHFYDEPKTKFNLLRHYDFIDSFSNQLVLKRRATSRVTEIIKQEEHEILLNTDYTVPSNNAFQLASFHIKYTLLGSAIRFLYQPPVIQITFFLENGTTRTHRLVKAAVEEPVLINKYITDNKDFANLLLNNSETLASVKRIKITAPEWAYDTRISVHNNWTILKDTKTKQQN